MYFILWLSWGVGAGRQNNNHGEYPRGATRELISKRSRRHFFCGLERYPECEVGTRKSIFALLKSFLQPRRGGTAALVYHGVLSSRTVINNNRSCTTSISRTLKTYETTPTMTAQRVRKSCNFIELYLLHAHLAPFP